MPKRKWNSRWDDMLMCGLCQEILTDNRRLSCMHAFCRKCLEEAKRKKPKSKKINCKMCEKETVLPKGGIVNLNKNSFLEKLVHLKSLKSNENLFLSCEICPDSKTGQATRYCNACYQNMCDACDNQHKKIKATKNHQVVHLRSDEHYEAMMKKPEVCFQHDTEIELICLDCNQAICFACLKAGHEFHKSQDIYDLAESIKRILRTDVENMSARISREKVLIEQLSQEVLEYDKKVNLEKQIVSDFAKSLIQRITSVESELTAQLEATSETAKQSSNVTRIALEDDIRRLDMHRTYLEQLLTMGSSFDLYQDEKLSDCCRTLIAPHIPEKTFQHIVFLKENELLDYFVTAILGEQFNSNAAKHFPKRNEFYAISRLEDTTKNEMQSPKILTALDRDGTSFRNDSQASTMESTELSKSVDEKITSVVRLAKKDMFTSSETSDLGSSISTYETSLGRHDSNSSLSSSTSSKLVPAETTSVSYVAKIEVPISPKINDNTSPRGFPFGVNDSNYSLSSSTSSKLVPAKTTPVSYSAKKELAITSEIDDNRSPMSAKQTSPLDMYDSNLSPSWSKNSKSELVKDDKKSVEANQTIQERQSQSKPTDSTRKSMQNSPISKGVEERSSLCTTPSAPIERYFSQDRHDSFLGRPNLGHKIILPNYAAPTSEISSNNLSMKSAITAKSDLSSTLSESTETSDKPNELEKTIPARGRVKNLVKNFNESSKATITSTQSDTLLKMSNTPQADLSRSQSLGDRERNKVFTNAADLTITQQNTKKLNPPKLLKQHAIKLDINTAVTGVAASDKIVYVLPEKSSEIRVFSLATGKLENRIFVENMTNPRDMAICTHRMCLYISDWSTFKVFRIDLKDNKILSWSCDHDYGSLSVTIVYHVLLTCHKNGKFIEYDTNGNLIKTVDVRHSDFMQINPWHVMQLIGNMFVVSFADELSGIHGLLLTDSNGTATRTLKSRKLEEQTNSKTSRNRTKSEERNSYGSSFSGIFHLAVSRKQWILAIDCNNSRILLLNNKLELHQELISSKYLDKPNRMFLDETNGRLYVADNQVTNRRPHNGQIKVFDIRECNL